jgi:hypothetical protein
LGSPLRLPRKSPASADNYLVVQQPGCGQRIFPAETVADLLPIRAVVGEIENDGGTVGDDLNPGHPEPGNRARLPARSGLTCPALQTMALAGDLCLDNR